MKNESTRMIIGLAIVAVVTIVAVIVISTISGNSASSFKNAQVVQSSFSDMTIRFPESWTQMQESADTSIHMISEDAAYGTIAQEEPAEKVEVGISLETYSNILFERLKNTPGSSGWENASSDTKEVKVGKNLTGLQREFTANMNNLELSYLHTVFKTDTVYVSILQWSKPSDFEDGVKLFEKILRTVVPPTALDAYAEETEEAEDVEEE